MKCTCGGKLKTLDSRNAPENTTRRRKLCLSCEKLHTTYEYLEMFPTTGSLNNSIAQRKQPKPRAFKAIL